MPAANATILGKRARLAALAARPAPQSSPPQIAITDLRAHAVREPAGGRSYVVVMVVTDAGITGLGEAAPVPDALTAASLILAQKPLLVGQDALAAQSLDRSLQQSKTGADLSAVLAGIQMALLDLLGKATKAPVHEVLSGRTRDKARAFTALYGDSDEALDEALAQAQAAGYRAFQVTLRMPEGPTRGREFYRRTRRLLERLRQKAGETADFILDCGGQTAPSQASELAAALEDFHLLWLEEPVAAVGRKALTKIPGESSTPVGLGRHLDSSDFQDLLRMDAIDILRPSIARLGIGGIRKIAALAETYYVAVAPFHRGGPIGTAAALHAAASIPNFFIQEVPLPADERDRRMRRELVTEPIETVSEGFLALPTGHGLGITLNEEALTKYPVEA